MVREEVRGAIRAELVQQAWEAREGLQARVAGSAGRSTAGVYP